jgi:hypothetical protein
LRAVAHYTGHRIPERDVRQVSCIGLEREIADAIVATLAPVQLVAAFGSLAAGADILFAEALVAKDVPLHLVLPFGVEDFKVTSVEPSGATWIARFEHVLSRAASVTVLQEPTRDDRAYAECSRVSMDRTIQAAVQFRIKAVQLAVWDGRSRGKIAGTSADVALWRRRGMETILVPVKRFRRGNLRRRGARDSTG